MHLALRIALDEQRGAMDDADGGLFTISDELRAQFREHTLHLRDARRTRKASLQLKTLVGTSRQQAAAVQAANVDLGAKLPTDKYEGDAVLRTLRKLLATIDERGFQRSSQQLRFHDAFERATSRVMYRDDWAGSEPAIQERNGWATTPSEILISTPRRFGKTFRCPASPSLAQRRRNSTELQPPRVCVRSIAIFSAALALSCKLEIVIFSPARRASRKLLERIKEFVTLLDCENRIVEYNQVSIRCLHARPLLSNSHSLHGYYRRCFG